MHMSELRVHIDTKVVVHFPQASQLLPSGIRLPQRIMHCVCSDQAKTACTPRSTDKADRVDHHRP